MGSTVQLLFKGTIMKLFLEAILGLAIAHSAFATCPSETVELSGPSGTITSPGWPGEYPYDSECYWKINCGAHGIFPKVSVHCGDVHMPIHWAEDAKCSCCPNTKSCCGIHKVVSITEPSCPSYKNDYKNGTITRLEDLTRNSEYPGSIYVAQDGHVFFYGYGYTGTGFEIKYERPEPCKDEKSSKYCKKAQKKGKCKKASVAKKCKKTCDACDK